MTESAHTAGLQKIDIAAARFLHEIAEIILDRHAALLPDLSSVVVLIAPRAATDFRHALIHAAHGRDHATLLLPTITTLADWVPKTMAARTLTQSERVLEVFQLLKKQRWFSSADTLAVSGELVMLADELTHNMVTLPRTLDEHASALARAYAIGKRNADFSFEANLTYEIWKSLAEPSASAVDPATSYALQLAALSARASRPLYVIDAQSYSKREQVLFAQYASRAEVTQFTQSWNADSPRERFLANAWVNAPGGLGKQSLATTPIDTIACYAARDVEDEATEALATIKRWLAHGTRNIAVVALDRLAARRLRALAEREQILLRDEIGWPVSTTVSATAVMRWLEAKRDGFYFQTLIDLLKSPFIFAEAEVKTRNKLAVLLIERAIHRAGVVMGLLKVREALIQLPRTLPQEIIPPQISADALLLMDRLIAADRQFGTQRRTPQAWLAALQESLATLGITAGLATDAAGAGLNDLLVQLETDVAACALKLTMSEWLDWLRMELETARFRDASIDSPIVMTSLEATRFRQFDAVILLGAADTNLPGKSANRAVFNQSVRAMLGLATRAETLTEITQDLYGLFCRSQTQWVSWQASVESADEPQNPSPWIAALELAAKRAWGGSLRVAKSLPDQTQPLAARSSKIAVRPAPMLAFEQVPERVSASGYQSLVDCPYRYFSRSVLKLNEADAVKEEMEKRDFGEYVHDILNRFHQRVAVVSHGEKPAMRAALLEETHAVFDGAIEQNFMARAWRLQWESAIDDYLAWQTAREGAGWRWHAGELKNGFPMLLDNGATVNIEGRLDRVDWRDEFGMAVIDYKARAVTTLQAKLKRPGEDVQLPVYTALAEASMPEREVNEAAYLSIERGGVKALAIDDAHDAAQENVVRLEQILVALHAGAPMPAQGVEAVCNFCEARGLCRRDYWLQGGSVNNG